MQNSLFKFQLELSLMVSFFVSPIDPCIEMRMAEMAEMGIGNKPCLDIRPSQDQINDRSISYAQLAKGNESQQPQQQQETKKKKKKKKKKDVGLTNELFLIVDCSAKVSSLGLRIDAPG